MSAEGTGSAQEIGMCLNHLSARKHLTEQLRHRSFFLRTDTATIKIYMTDIFDRKIRQEFLVQNLTDLVVGLMNRVDTLRMKTRSC